MIGLAVRTPPAISESGNLTEAAGKVAFLTRTGVTAGFTPSFPRKRESMFGWATWIPAFAGMMAYRGDDGLLQV